MSDAVLEDMTVRAELCSDLLARVQLELAVVNPEPADAAEVTLRFDGLSATVTSFCAEFGSGRCVLCGLAKNVG